MNVKKIRDVNRSTNEHFQVTLLKVHCLVQYRSDLILFVDQAVFRQVPFEIRTRDLWIRGAKATCGLCCTATHLLHLLRKYFYSFSGYMHETSLMNSRFNNAQIEQQDDHSGTLTQAGICISRLIHLTTVGSQFSEGPIRSH